MRGCPRLPPAPFPAGWGRSLFHAVRGEPRCRRAGRPQSSLDRSAPPIPGVFPLPRLPGPERPSVPPVPDVCLPVLHQVAGLACSLPTPRWGRYVPSEGLCPVRGNPDWMGFVAYAKKIERLRQNPWRAGTHDHLKAPEASGRCEAGIALTRMRPPPTSAGDRLAEFL